MAGLIVPATRYCDATSHWAASCAECGVMTSLWHHENTWQHAAPGHLAPAPATCAAWISGDDTRAAALPHCHHTRHTQKTNQRRTKAKSSTAQSSSIAIALYLQSISYKPQDMMGATSYLLPPDRPLAYGVEFLRLERGSGHFRPRIK
jgi:hypothetical protein